jgi:phytoene synthase
MDLYESVSYEISQIVTTHYSTSFAASTRLFPKSIRKHIYGLYGLVRIADEIVDTYKGLSAEKLLTSLHIDVLQALKDNYSTNPVVYAFSQTARTFGIDKSLIDPFFKSMAMDLTKLTYTQGLYEEYIYGSAQVIGLMCLRVFCEGDQEMYLRLRPGAEALGAAYQKVNFLRDLSGDNNELGRMYFPGLVFSSIDQKAINGILSDIGKDFSVAKIYISKLPKKCQLPVRLSYTYYSHLLKKLEKTPIEILKTQRIRIPNSVKIGLFVATSTKHRFGL